MRAMDAAAALAGLVGRLTASGGPFEIVEEDVRGHRMPVYRNRNRNRSLPELLDAAAGHGEKDYLVTPDRHLSYTQHDAAVAALATRLRDEYGIAKGDRVAILGANSPEWIVAFWAVTSLGAIVAAFNAWWAPPELAHAVELSAPKLIIAEARYAEDLAADAPVLRTAGLCDASARGQRPHTDIDEDDPAVSVEELADFARQRLAYYKVPTDWRLSTEPLPRTVTGKVIRRPSILARIGDAPVR